MNADDQRAARKEFAAAVNMSPAELIRWLDSPRSRAVGQKKGGPATESTGHRSGRRIVELKRRRVSTYSDDDYAFMRKVVGYVGRHGAQRPDGDVTDSRWRASLKNWGHDPLKTTTPRRKAER